MTVDPPVFPDHLIGDGDGDGDGKCVPSACTVPAQLQMLRRFSIPVILITTL